MKKESLVNPYEVKGNVDYEKIVKEFGVGKISAAQLSKIKKIAKSEHFMLKRGVFFAQRDLDWVLSEYSKGNKFFLYTGRAPSGPIHLGHMYPWIFTKWLQDKFNVEMWFHFPDEEKFLIKHNITYEDSQKWLKENMLDVVALGFDPKKTHFLIDTKHASLMYKEAVKIAKKITFSMVKGTFGFNENTNIGSIFYTSMQAVPAFLPSVIKNKKIPCLIPHGIDQDPHFRLTRDILPKLGHYKPASIQCSFLPPLTGIEGKMSASSLSQHVIYTTDDEKSVKTKINKYAFSGGKDTLEAHRKHGGNPDIDVSYQYLRMLLEPSDTKLKKIHDDYKSGKLLTGELKAIAIEKINTFLKSHQKQRKLAEKKIDKLIYKHN